MEERIIDDVPDGVQALAAGTRWVATSTTHQQAHDAQSDRLVATVQGGGQPRLRLVVAKRFRWQKITAAGVRRLAALLTALTSLTHIE
eukprot:5896894-Pyramimonas_sp.AAC.1